MKHEMTVGLGFDRRMTVGKPHLSVFPWGPSRILLSDLWFGRRPSGKPFTRITLMKTTRSWLLLPPLLAFGVLLAQETPSLSAAVVKEFLR
jgi:hypothetical protein